MSDQLNCTVEDVKTPEDPQKTAAIVTDKAPTTDALGLATSIKKGATLKDVAKEDDESNKDAEDLETKKARIDRLWAAWNEIARNTELVSLFDRKEELQSDKDPYQILKECGYPERTKISELQFAKWKVNLDPKFVKDGNVYLLRGDHPNLDKKGFYSRPYGYGKQTTGNLTEQLHSTDEVGYFLYNDERYLTVAKPSQTASIVEELAYDQSARGASSFVSTTTNLETAIAGTGNQPDAAEQAQYEVYVIKVPLDAAINSNTNNFFGMNETEYLVPDYISPNEIVAKFPRDNREGVYQYMHEQLGVTKEDLGMTSE